MLRVVDAALAKRAQTMTAIAVTIAGSDSGGGAGIQADLKTFSALGVYGASVITALTAQNTKGVTGIHDVPPEFITAQIDAVFSDLKVGAVKIGMLSNAAAIAAVAAGLDRHRQTNIVLDPVMVATSGDRLLKPDAVEKLRRLLIPKALVVTPNLPEAAALLDTAIAEDEAAMRHQAHRLLTLGAKAVLIKGGHDSGPESVDLLVEPDGDDAACRAERIATRNTHGTGCTLSSAIAAGLAKGLSLTDAVRGGQELRHRGDRRRRPAVDRLGPRPGPSFSSPVVSTCSTRESGANHDENHAKKACSSRSSGCSRLRLAAPSLALRAGQALAHGDLVAEAPARPRHVGRARRRAHQARCPAASSTSRFMPRARSCRPSRCSMPSAATSPRSATPPRSTGRARCRRRRSSPPCRSGSRPASTSPGSMPAAARRCGTSSTRRSASSRSWAATPASAWAAGSATRSRAAPISAA